MRSPTTPELLTHIQGDVSTLARVMRLTPRGADAILFTDHDQNITIDGDVYLADIGFEASAIKNVVGGGNANLEVSIFIETDDQRNDILGGLYAGAAIEINAVNFEDPTTGVMPLAVGSVTNVSLPYRHKAILSFEGKATEANRYMSEVYSPTCRAVFCDARCTLNINDFRETFTVETADGIRGFTTSGITGTAGYFDLGAVRWLSGDNAGATNEIRSSNAGAIVLLIRPRFTIQVGDTGVIERGCAKTLEACRDYNNVLNFRGEPYMPGNDFVQAPSYAVPQDDAGTPPIEPPNEGVN